MASSNHLSNDQVSNNLMIFVEFYVLFFKHNWNPFQNQKTAKGQMFIFYFGLRVTVPKHLLETALVIIRLNPCISSSLVTFRHITLSAS